MTIAWKHFYAEVPADTRLTVVICGGCGQRLQMMRDQLLWEPLQQFQAQHAGCAGPSSRGQDAPGAAVAS